MISPLEIELASLASWPAFEQVEHYGWILRYADGHTKRANCVNVLNPGNSNLSAMIHHCESFYKKRSQSSIFRLLSFVEDSTQSTLDRYLASADYAYVDPSYRFSINRSHSPLHCTP